MAQTRPVGLTARPTPEFRRQHDVEAPRVDARAFRQGWRVQSRLDQLQAADRITREEWHAARDYAVAWAIARTLRHTDRSMTGIPSSASAGAVADARLDAGMKLRVVETAIGGFATALVVACVVEDLAWARTARKMHVHPETVRDWTVVAIRALARVWTGATGRQDAEPPRPTRQDVDAL